MLSLETCQKLKEAGLKWEPQLYDMYYANDGEVAQINQKRINRWHKADAGFKERHPDWESFWNYYSNLFWLPRLDQLLAEIYGKGYEYSLHGPNNNYLDLPKTPWIAISNKQDAWIFDATTPDEAAAEALIWILEQEGKVG